MSEDHYQFLVLGGGSAGFAAARLAADHVDRVAIVDGSEELGGLCILRGCMPSKTLLYSAEVLHLAKMGNTFGLNISRPSMDMKAVQDRKRRIIGEFADYRKKQLHSGRFELIPQQGRLRDANTVLLDNGKSVTAEKILISTGSKVSTPSVPGLDSTPFLTSDDILNLEELPDSIIVLGGGVVACELTQFLARAGSHVIQIQRSPYLLKDMPVDASATVAQSLTRDGVELHTGTSIEQIYSSEDGGVFVSFRKENRVLLRRAQYLFNALGRDPNTGGLGLDKTNIELAKTGHIKTNAFQQTSEENIYAAGDCAGPNEIVHIAILQGECAARHALLLEDAKPVNYNSLLSVVFTDPQVATVGPSLTELQKKYPKTLRMAEFPFFDHGKSILMEAKSGYVRVYANKTAGKIVRAECVGKDAGELIHALAPAVHHSFKVSDWLSCPWYHPTLGEIWTYPLEELMEESDDDDSMNSKFSQAIDEELSPTDVVSQLLSQDDW